MVRLTSRERRHLPARDFALPGRRYPIDTANRARDALSRVEQFGTRAEVHRVRRAVERRYPGMGVRENPDAATILLLMGGIAALVLWMRHRESATRSPINGMPIVPYSGNDPYIPGNYVPGEPTNFYNPSPDPGVVVPGGKLLL